MAWVGATPSFGAPRGTSPFATEPVPGNFAVLAAAAQAVAEEAVAEASANLQAPRGSRPQASWPPTFTTMPSEPIAVAAHGAPPTVPMLGSSAAAASAAAAAAAAAEAAAASGPSPMFWQHQQQHQQHHHQQHHHQQQQEEQEQQPYGQRDSVTETSGSFGGSAVLRTPCPHRHPEDWVPSTPEPVHPSQLKVPQPDNSAPFSTDVDLPPDAFTAIVGGREIRSSKSSLLPTPARAGALGAPTGPNAGVEVGIQVNRKSLMKHAGRRGSIETDVSSIRADAETDADHDHVDHLEMDASLPNSRATSAERARRPFSTGTATMTMTMQQDEVGAAGTGEGRGRTRSRGRRSIADLVYPSLGADAPMGSLFIEVDDAESIPTSWTDRATLARRTTEVVYEEMKNLDTAWGLEGSTSDSADCTEHAVARFLRKVAQNAERTFLENLLRPMREPKPEEESDDDMETDEADEEAQLEAAKEELEVALVREDRRLESLHDLARDLEAQRSQDIAAKATASSCRDLSQFVAEVIAELQSSANQHPEAAAREAWREDAKELDQCLQRMTVLEQYLLQTQLKIEDAKEKLRHKERELAAAGSSFRQGFTESLRRVRGPVN